MELGGDEKRIQALFSELSFEDQSRVPQFGHLWARAQAIQESALRRAFAPLREKTLMVFVIAAACLLGLWTWYKFTPAPNSNVTNYPNKASYTPSPEKLARERIKPQRQKHIARRRQIDRRIATEAALLSSWQSPTQQFMTSPTALALGSLPSLNQSAKDLESFLSKNNEIMKESNQ